MSKKLVEIIHTTMLGMYNSCPYNFKNSSGPIDPSLTYKGDILNISVTSQGKVSPFLKWMSKNLKYDFKETEILRQVFIAAREKMQNVNRNYQEVYQEAKMLYKYSEEYYVVGTPDLFFYDPDRDLWVIRDWKMSTHSWYGNEEVTRYDMQPIIYPLMVMEYMGVKEAEFMFRCYDKKNGKLWEFGKKITYDQAKKQADEVIGRYIESKEMEEYEPRENKKCWFCQFKKNGQCPLYKKKVDVVETTIDDDF